MSTSGPGVDTQEMVQIYRVIRREFGQLPRLLRSAADDRAIRADTAVGERLDAFAHPDLTTFRRLDELGLIVTG